MTRSSQLLLLPAQPPREVKYDYRSVFSGDLCIIMLNPNLKQAICVVECPQRRGIIHLDEAGLFSILEWDTVAWARFFETFGFLCSFSIPEDYFVFYRDMEKCRENLARNDPPVPYAVLKVRIQDLVALYDRCFRRFD